MCGKQFIHIVTYTFSAFYCWKDHDMSYSQTENEKLPGSKQKLRIYNYDIIVLSIHMKSKTCMCSYPVGL